MQHYYYTTRHGWDGWTDVVLCSVHTGDVKEIISSHRNAHNARQRAAAMARLQQLHGRNAAFGGPFRKVDEK